MSFRSGMEMLLVLASQTSQEGSTSSFHKYLLKRCFINVSIFFFSLGAVLSFLMTEIMRCDKIFCYISAHEEHHAFEGGRSRHQQLSRTFFLCGFVLFCFAHERVLIFFWEGGVCVIILGQILEHSICFMYHFMQFTYKASKSRKFHIF